MKVDWKLFFPIIAIGLPVGMIGGIILSKKIAANREEQAVYDRARAAGMLLTLADLKAIAPADADNAMVPLHDVWRRKDAFRRQMNAPATSWSRKDIDEIVEAAEEASKRRDSFDLPSTDAIAASDEYYTFFVLGEAAKIEAVANPDRARVLFVLIESLSQKFITSKDPACVRAGLREHFRIPTQVLLTTFFARAETGDVAILSQPSSPVRTDLELAQVACGKALATLDLLANGSFRMTTDPPVSATQEMSLHDADALRKAKRLLISGFTSLKDPKRMRELKETDSLEKIIPTHEDDPKVSAILSIVLDNADLNGILRLKGSKRPIPMDLLPWYIDACKAGAKAPAGLTGAKDRYGMPIHFKSYAGGMAIYTFGQDGKEDDPKKWKDDRWIRVETPSAAGRTLRPRVTLRD